jgi:hypothetical protein
VSLMPKKREQRACHWVEEKPWFYRARTLQEGRVASKANPCCGSYRMPLHVYTSFSRSFAWYLEDIIHSRITETMSQCRRSYENGTASLSDLLMQIVHRLASDPRDKVFSLLGLTSLSFTVSLKADYSMSIEEAYKNATKSLH